MAKVPYDQYPPTPKDKKEKEDRSSCQVEEQAKYLRRYMTKGNDHLMHCPFAKL